MEIDDPDLVDTETEDSNASYSTTIANQNINSDLPSISLMPSSDIKIPGFNPFSNLTILKKGTFHEWKAKIITALSAARLGSFVLTDQSPPTDPVKLEEHTVRNFQALSIIQTTVDSEHFQLVANAQTARAAYLSILAQYDDSGGLSTAMIFSDLVSLRLEDDGELSSHIHRFRTLHNELTSNMIGTPDLKISEAFVAILLLKSLPPKYSAIVQTTLASFETIKLARIYPILAMEANRSTSTPLPSDTALAASSSSSHSKPPPRKPKDKDV